MSPPDTAPPSSPAVPAPDGRRERSRSSRARIVAAMLDLVANGTVSPSAAEVAEHAGVGLRSVFRHFKDMDALYREMTQAITLKVAPILATPPVGETWQQRLRDIAGRRAHIFETIMPYRMSAELRRFDSPYLMEDFKRMQKLEADILAGHLPSAVREDREGALGLGVILSFSTWRLLRRDQGLAPEEAAGVVRSLLEAALARWPEG